MPHFIIHCSKDITEDRSATSIIEHVSQAAISTKLFESADIKVYINAFEHCKVGQENTSFIHVFSHIMEGRTVLQRRALSELIVSTLSKIFPDVTNIAMNIYEFEKSTYCNLNILNQKSAKEIKLDEFN